MERRIYAAAKNSVVRPGTTISEIALAEINRMIEGRFIAANPGFGPRHVLRLDGKSSG
jgi:hypothetical protein